MTASLFPGRPHVRKSIPRILEHLGILRLRSGVRPRSAELFAFDPLSHPEIARMSLHQLADLPFNR